MIQTHNSVYPRFFSQSTEESINQLDRACVQVFSSTFPQSVKWPRKASILASQLHFPPCFSHLQLHRYPVLAHVCRLVSALEHMSPQMWSEHRHALSGRLPEPRAVLPEVVTSELRGRNSEAVARAKKVHDRSLPSTRIFRESSNQQRKGLISQDSLSVSGLQPGAESVETGRSREGRMS